MTAKPQVECSLVVNVARGDAPILAHTLPHILNTHKARFAEVLIVVDERVSEGRILKSSTQYTLEELYSALENVRKQGFGFRQIVVDYSPEAVRKTYLKWFGRTLKQYRCAGGTPIYAFLYALEQATYDYRLHLDSDMLIYDPGPKSWLQKAFEVIENIPEVLFVNQTMGLQTKDHPAPDVFPSFDLGYGERVSQLFSSRCFLFSMKKLEDVFLPITPAKHPLYKLPVYALQKRSPYRALEQMIGLALYRKHFYRGDLNIEWGLSLHAWEKHVFGDPHIQDVLHRITLGDIPTTHTGIHDLEYGLFPNAT